MPEFRQLTGAGMRGIDRMLRGMERLDDLGELERHMVSEAPGVLDGGEI